MALGLLLIWIAPIEWLIIPGCILVGLGYGIIQPMLYDKTTQTALPQKTTLALAFVMMMNYLAILLYPFIVDFFQWVFHTQSHEFPFIFNLLITVVTLFWAYRRRHTFLFNPLKTFETAMLRLASSFLFFIFYFNWSLNKKV